MIFRDTVRCRGLTVIADIQGCTASTINTLLESLYLFEVSHFVRTTLTFNPLPDDKNLDWSNLKQIADDILKCI